MTTTHTADQAVHPAPLGQAAVPITSDGALLAMRRVLLRTRAVVQCVGLSRSQIYALAAEGKFPRPVKHSSNLSVWPSNEIQDWIDGRIADRNAALTVSRSAQQGERGHD